MIHWVDLDCPIEVNWLEVHINSEIFTPMRNLKTIYFILLMIPKNLQSSVNSSYQEETNPLLCRTDEMTVEEHNTFVLNTLKPKLELGDAIIEKFAEFKKRVQHDFGKFYDAEAAFELFLSTQKFKNVFLFISMEIRFLEQNKWADSKIKNEQIKATSQILNEFTSKYGEIIDFFHYAESYANLFVYYFKSTSKGSEELFKYLAEKKNTITKKINDVSEEVINQANKVFKIDDRKKITEFLKTLQSRKKVDGYAPKEIRALSARIEVLLLEIKGEIDGLWHFATALDERIHGLQKEKGEECYRLVSFLKNTNKALLDHFFEYTYAFDFVLPEESKIETD